MKIKINRELKIGFFFVIILLIFIWGVNFLKSKDIFSRERKCFAFYDKVDGLVPSNPIYISGVKVGYVGSVKFVSNESSKVKVTLVFNSPIVIPKNSIARIYSSDLMGSRAIQIIMGNSPDNIKTGDTLSTEIEADLKEEINRQVLPLKLKAEEMMSSFDSVLIAVKLVFNETTRNNISKSFENIKISLDNIKNTTFNLDTLVTSQRNRLTMIISNIESISHNIRNNNDKISNIISNFSSLSDTLAKVKINQTINQTNKALSDINIIIEKINRGEGSLGLLINNDSLYRNLNASALDLNLLLKDIKQNPDKYFRISVFGGKNKK